MSLDAYRIFHEAARTGSITRAAGNLFLSQPAVSKSIRQLEERLGIPLFVRLPKGVELTAEGHVFFRYIDQAMAQITAGERMADRMQRLEAGAVRVGMSHTLCRHWFLPHLRAFHDLHPHLRLQVYSRTGPETLRMLYAGDLDFGVVSRPEDAASFHFAPLLELEDIFVTSRRGQVPAAPIPLGEITRFPLMLLEGGNTSRQGIERHFEQQGIPLKAEIEVSSMDLLIEYAKIGLGVAAVVRSFVGVELAAGELFEIPVEPAPGKRTVGILTHGELPLSHAADAFVRFLLQPRA